MTDSPPRAARRLVQAADSVANRLFGWRGNPLHQSGTIAAAMLLVMLVTGLYLVLFYRIGTPAASVAALAADPWLGSWIRSLHRYASDVFVVAAVVHGFRLWAQRRTWGTRSLAWLSGLSLLGLGLACAWTGFVMAWDSFGYRLALAGSRLFDVLPILSEPVSRIFAGDAPVPSAFFFVNLFLHIALPLAMGIGLWLHVSRVARPVLLPPRPLLWGMIFSLTALSLLRPAPLGPAAEPLALVTETPVNLVTSWWLPLAESWPAGVTWAVLVVISAGLFAVPWLTRRPRVGKLAPSLVDPALCTGCNQCPQDCPWDAITMVARSDERSGLVALVDPTRCVSCGICAGSCAPMGVGPSGQSGRDQLATLRTDTLPRLQADASMVLICCAQAPASHRRSLEARGAVVHPVSCVGNLHTSVVELLIRGGARAVMIAGCPPRDCLGREGPRWLHARLFEDREAELQARVDRRRVGTMTLAPGMLAETIAAWEQWEASLEGIEPAGGHPPDTADLLVECDQVVTGAGVTE